MKYKNSSDKLIPVRRLPKNKNLFAGGGVSLSSGVGMAAAGMEMVGGMVDDLKGDAQKQLGAEARAAANNAQIGAQSKDDDFDAIMNDAANRQELQRVTMQDMGGISAGDAIMGAAGQGLKGAAAGAKAGPMGAAAGAALGVLTSAIGSIGKNIHAKKQRDKTNKAIAYTEDFNDRSMAIRAENVQAQKIANLEANFAAFGGPFSTHGGFFTNGLQYINSGGTHEMNPNEGVPVSFDPEGKPNLVEEGETIFNDYVFSNRLMVPMNFKKRYKFGKKPMTFAEASKRLAKESEERPNDPISRLGLQRFMQELSEAQETVRAKQAQRSTRTNKFATGGRPEIDVPPTEEEQALTQVALASGSPVEVVPATSAPIQVVGSPNQVNSNDGLEFGPFSGRIGGDSSSNVYIPTNTNSVNNIRSSISTPADTINREQIVHPSEGTYNNNIIEDTGLMNHAREVTGLQRSPGYISPFDTEEEATRAVATQHKENSVDKYNPIGDTRTPLDKFSDALRYASAIPFDHLMNTNDRRGKVKDYTQERVQFDPIGNQLTYNPADTYATLNKMNAQSGATRRALLANAGMNRGAAAASLLAADNNYINNVGEAIRRDENANFERKRAVENFNRQTNMVNSQGKSQTDMFNSRMNMGAFQLNQQAENMREERRRNYWSNFAQGLNDLATSLGNIGKENMNRRTAENYQEATGNTLDRAAQERVANYYKNKKAKADTRFDRRETAALARAAKRDNRRGGK